IAYVIIYINLSYNNSSLMTVIKWWVRINLGLFLSIIVVYYIMVAAARLAFRRIMFGIGVVLFFLALGISVGSGWGIGEHGASKAESYRESAPIRSPTTTKPVAMPMRLASAPEPLSSRLIRSTSASSARTARSASSSWACG